MIKYFFCFTFLLSGSVSLSQSNFFKWFDTPWHEITNDAIETSHGDYLLVGQKGINPDSLNAFILKLNQDGSIMNEVILPRYSGNSCINTIDKMPGPGLTFLLTSSRDSLSQDGFYSILSLIVMSDSLQIIFSKSYISSKGRRYQPWKAKFTGDGSLYLLYKYDTIGNGFTYDLGVGRFDRSFERLSIFHQSNPYPWYVGQDIFYRDTDSTIQVFYIGQNMDERYSPLQIISLSKNLELISNHPGPDQIVTNVSATRLNDSLYYLYGTEMGSINLQHQHTGCYQMNDSDVVVKSVEVYEHPDTILYTGRGGYNLILYPATSSAIMTGIYNFDPPGMEWQTKPTWIRLTRTDIELNLIDSRFYGGDASYIPYSIKPTRDGGALITGNRFDYNMPQNLQWDVFVLKTDSNGTVVSLPEQQKEMMTEAILAPNPGTDNCFAILGSRGKPATLRIFDMNGKLVIGHEINQLTTKIDMAELSKGIYPYSFEQEGRIIGKGKWIKE